MVEAGFLDAVADRSGRPVEEVASVLTTENVPTTATLSAPHRLRVSRLAFTGKKAGISSDDINFDRSFGDGLWAITTKKNDSGKTSIVEIMMWALRGQPKRLQDDVRSWLRTVTLEGSIDDDRFIVEFDLNKGEPTGSLTCGSEKQPFSSDVAFADTMSSFMMERLGLDSFPQWVNNKGISTHGWPLYSTVLYMPREAQSAVIGDTTESGLAQRLVLLFVGVRWAHTRITCQAALRKAEAETSEQQNDSGVIRDAVRGVLERRRDELEATRAEIAGLPDDLSAYEQIEATQTKWLDLIDLHATTKSELQDAQRDLKAARREAARRRKQLTDLTEAALAQELFHGLDPSRCPRCSAAIGVDRREKETDTHSCALCNRHFDLNLNVAIDESDIGDDDADEPMTVEELGQLVTQIDAIVNEEQAHVTELGDRSDTLTREMADVKTRIDAHAHQFAQVQNRRDLESRASALEAVIVEIDGLANQTIESVSPDSDHDSRIAILDAAAKEAKKRVDEGFAEVMEQVNDAILDLAQRFGFDNLQDLRLDLAARLRLTKGNVDTWFSKQTPGEKLRLRIAVIVALLRVANHLGIGRHPGLLLIDSIGAEETEPGNLEEFMRQLADVTTELGIETIVASARPEILTHVAESRQITARQDGYLW